jgi:hypothetical protein
VSRRALFGHPFKYQEELLRITSYTLVKPTQWVVQVSPLNSPASTSNSQQTMPATLLAISMVRVAVVVSLKAQDNFHQTAKVGKGL